MSNIQLIHGSAHDLAQIPAGSVHCLVTSPPYYSLRVYEGEQGIAWPTVEYAPIAGLAPIVIQGCDPDCDHEWCNEVRTPWANSVPGPNGLSKNTEAGHWMPKTAKGACVKCGGWYGPLGLEPTIEAYIGHLILCLREWWRVLRDDGTCWVNLGDSYAANRGYQVTDTKWRDVGNNHGAAVPAGLKPKDSLLVPARFALAAQADGWYVRSDIIWHKPNCLSGGTMVYARTQKGEMPMMVKDMVRLDPSTVQLWSGEKWTQAVAWYATPRPENPIEIELRNGQRIGCTPDHLWPTQRGNVRADGLVVGDIIATSSLPEPAGPRSPQHLPDSIGWFVGLYLAEGSRSGDCIQIASHKDEIGRYHGLQRIVKMYGGTCRMHLQEGNKATINLYGKVLNAILDTYISGNTAQHKRLSPACWQRSNEFLGQVLDGYLSGDGHYDEKNGRWRLGFTRNYNLESDLRTLCARLGIKLTLKLSTSKIGERIYPTFRGELRFKPSQHHNSKDGGEVVRIGRSRARQFWDISVADEPHLFALASGVLTHNCMPESVTDRPTRSHEFIFLLAKSERYAYDAEAIREPLKQTSIARLGGGDDRQKYANGVPGQPPHAIHQPRPNIKAVRFGGDKGEDIENRLYSGNAWDPAPGRGANKRDVWRISTRGYSKAHFATFPEDIPEICIKAGTSAYGCCSSCGAPYERVTLRVTGDDPPGYNGSGFATGKTKEARAHLSEPGQGPRTVERQHTGWQPTCTCNVHGTEYAPDDLDVIATPTGSRSGEDPTLRTGRAGWNRPRGSGEGQRPITRYEQRQYAAQIKASPFYDEMKARVASDTTFAHYVRTDASGARPLPPEILEEWIERGWLEQVEPPRFEPYPVVPCTVLDPFVGSGTTLRVALRLGRNAIGVDLSQEYLETLVPERLTVQREMALEVAL